MALKGARLGRTAWPGCVFPDIRTVSNRLLAHHVLVTNRGDSRAALLSMKPYAFTLGLFGLLVSPLVAQQANRIISSSDSAFVTGAAQGGMAEVELGNLAVQKAANQQVKQFGQRMVTDHTKINDELKAVTSSKGISLPTALDPKDQATKKHLEGLNGAAFDHAYMEDMVRDHKHDIAEFQREADHGGDPDVKAFASKTLPILQEHLRLAEQTLSQVKK